MHTILIATEDDEHRAYVVELLKEHPRWKLRPARSRREVLQILSMERVDLLLTDAEMPDVSPSDFLKELRSRHPVLPVVLMTTKGPNEALVRTLRLGAASYVPRSSMARDLLSTVSRVLALCGRYKLGPELLACRTNTETTFVLRNDIDLFPPVIAYIQEELEHFHNCTPSERVNTAIAIEEALLNAMVHGNLDIGPEIREEGIEAYERRIAQKQKLAPYEDRTITVTCAFSKKEASIRVVDQGSGFDAACLPDPTSPENRGKSGGRGLLLIRSFMDEVRFNERGNEITMVKRRK